MQIPIKKKKLPDNQPIMIKSIEKKQPDNSSEDNESYISEDKSNEDAVNVLPPATRPNQGLQTKKSFDEGKTLSNKLTIRPK